MATAIRIWRVLLWVMGGLFLLPSAWMMWTTVELADGARYYGPLSLLGLYLTASLLSLMSAWGMRRGRAWARRVSWAAAAVQTIAFPVFTPLGIFGLILLWRGDTGRSSGRSSAVTTGAMGVAVVSMVTVLLSIEALVYWAKSLGYPAMAALPSPIPAIWLGILLQLAIHEGGHALAVIGLGAHLHHMRVGPLWWRRESGRTWVEFSARSLLAGSVGWTPASPHDLTRQRLFAAAGGPAANLASALVGLALFPWLGELGLSRQWPWTIALMTVGAAFGAAACWPHRAGFQDSDGATIHGLLTNERFRRLSEIFLRQGMSDSSALRPRDWSRADVTWSLELEDEVPFASQRGAILLAACAHYLDGGDAAEAVGHAYTIRDLARAQPKRFSPNVYPEAAFILAFHGGDLEAARELWALRPAGETAQFELSTELACAAMAEGQPAAMARATQCSGRYGSSGALDYLRDQLRMLEAGTLAGEGYFQSAVKILNS